MLAKPIIGITMGDPAGIGPEITVKALANPRIYEKCHPVVLGDRGVLEQALKLTGVDLEIRTLKSLEEAAFTHGKVDLFDLANVDLAQLKLGKIQAMGGKAAFGYIKKAVELALSGQIDAIATGPINKEALKAGQVNHIGHTEILGDLTETKDPLTMFQVLDLRVFFLTRHVSLRRACELITKERTYDYIVRCTQALESLGVSQPKLAVAGLNPHSGEHGLFGFEEENELVPAINRAQEEGLNVVGPIPADAVFYFALKGSYDAVLSLYHDQGHIATKMVDFERTVAITIGLPFLRTSVDHGTAFDIAGTGKASAVSMEEAVRLAAKYALSYKNSLKRGF